MNKKSSITLAVFVLVLLLVYLSFSKRTTRPAPISQEPHGQSTQAGFQKQSPVSVANPTIPDLPADNLTHQDKENLGKIISAFSAPISFYGKVIDQYGQPVADAKIHYSAANQYFGSSSKYEGLSDADGAFSIEGIKGAGLYVSVYKEGYDGTPQSGGGFGYSVPSGNRPPSKGQPATFMLRKKGETEPLVIVDRDVVVPIDGTAVDINLKTGKPVAADRGDLRIECWANTQNKDDRGHYDWQARLSAPGGGLLERSNLDFDFEAPTDGYEVVREFRMPSSSERWKNSFDENYFVKLGDGTYARMRFRITTGGDHFASITSYLNPTPGDRNLEFDPAKQIKVK